MAIRSEFLITRQGKQYVLYAGLLDEAHSRGLKSINTAIEELLFDQEGEPIYAVVRATVELEDGRTFSGIGDATRSNVGRNIKPHIIRMAETRAKARALRDAVNVGTTALEELGDDAEPAVETSAKAEVKRSPEVPIETPKEQAEAVDKRGGLEHRALLYDVEALLKCFPDGYFDDIEEKRAFAQRGVREAQLAVDRLRTLLEYEKDGVPATEEKQQAPSGYAHDEQVELLTKYADQLYSERSKAVSGSEWLLSQRKISSFHVLTKREAKDWIDEMREELRAKEEVKA